MKPRNVILMAIGMLVIGSLILSSRKGESPTPEASPTTASAPAATTASAAVPAAMPDTGRIPHYFNSVAEAGELPRIVPAERFAIPVVAKAYRVAAGMREVLVQQPCYCYCDKMGHGSLVDCFATDHGAG